MKISYIEPVPGNKKRIERIFGCSYAKYLFPNIYILIIFASLQKRYKVSYNQEFLYLPDVASYRKFIGEDKSDIYLIFSVNLSMDEDIAFAKRISGFRDDVIIIFLGPAPTFFTDRFLINKNTYVVRGEPDIAAVELVDALAKKEDRKSVV